MISPFNLNRILWLILALLALFAAAMGLTVPSIYQLVIDRSIEPGVFTQDILAALAAGLLLILVSFAKESQLHSRVIIHGLLGFFFYAFGIYAIERVYTWLYPVYLAIFGLSLYALIYGMATFPKELSAKINIKPVIRTGAAVYGISIAVMFNIIWFSQLIPLIQSGNRIDYMYSIYIIDLCFIMPAFVIAAVMALRRQTVGLIGLPSLFVLGTCILSPLALAEWLKPASYGMPRNMGEFWLYAALSLAFFLAAIIYLKGLKIQKTDA